MYHGEAIVSSGKCNDPLLRIVTEMEVFCGEQQRYCFYGPPRIASARIMTHRAFSS